MPRARASAWANGHGRCRESEHKAHPSLQASGDGTPIRPQPTTDPAQYGLDPSLAPSESIQRWLRGGGEGAARMPDAFQAMMGGPPGIMMGVAPGEPRDGSLPLSPTVLAEMARSLRPPVDPGPHVPP